MLIKNIQLTSFGKFNNEIFEFKDGINIVTGKNETGKTTIHNFMSSMFYFLSADFKDTKLINKDIDDYKPWYNSDRFEGTMVLEKGDKDYSVQKDFTEDSNDIIIQEDYFKTIDKDSDEVYIGLTREAFVNLIGVADLSGENGRKMIRGAKENIVDILSSSNPTLDYNNIMSSLESKITKLENDKNISDLRNELAQYIAKREGLKETQRELKNQTLTSYDYKKQKKEIDIKLVHIEDSIKYLKYNAVKDKYQKVIELKGLIEEIEGDISELVIFNDNNLEVVDEYIDANTEIIGMRNKIKERMQNIEVLKSEIASLSITADAKAIKLMAEDIYASDFMLDFENHIKAKSEVIEYSQKIDDYKRQIEASDDIQDKEREKQNLERDYYELSNNKRFLEKSNEDSLIKKEMADNEALLESLSVKGKPLFTYLIASVLSFFVFTTISILENPENYLMLVSAILIGISIGAVIVCVSLLVKNKQDVSQTEYVINHLRQEVEKNDELVKKTSVRNDEILRRYGFNGFQELENHYFNMKNSSDEDHSLVILLNEAINKKEQAKTNEGMLYRRLVKWIDDTQLNGLISIDDDERAIRFIEEYSKRCVKHINYTNSIFRANFDNEKDEETIKGLIDKIRQNVTFNHLIDFSIEDIVEKKERFIELSMRKTKVQEEQRSYLQGQSIEELKTKLNQEEENIEGINTATIFDDDIDFLNDLFKKTNTKSIELTEQMKKLKDNIIANDEKMETAKSVNVRIMDIEYQLEKHNKKIDILKKTLINIKTVAKKIHNSFEENLQNNMNYFLMKLTDTYEEVHIDESQNITVREAERTMFIPVDKMSLGTRDLMAFILKLGLIKTINDKNNTIPLVVDDQFIQFDDDRLGTVIREISKFRRQIIMITGQTREKRICKRLNLEVNHIQL